MNANASAIHFTSKDITTVYDALRQCSARQVACALVGSKGAAEAGLPEGDRMLRIAERRASSLLGALSRIDPDYESSARVILPWKASHLAALPNMSWPDALGCRIAFPSNVTPGRKAALLADVLLGMSYV